MSTIREVAQSAGVSTATVSRVLSNPEIVSETTRKAVMTAVETLGYVPSSAPKVLRTQRTGNIIVTVPDISNPFFSSVIRGVEEAAQARGYSVLLGDTRHDVEREERYAEMLLRRQADGLIFLGHRLPRILSALVERSQGRAPVVNGCEFSPDLDVSSAHIDNAKAAGEVMDYLYGLGHRRIGVITGPLASPISRDRLEGAQASAATHGAAEALAIAVGDFSIESGEREARALLSDSAVTALFCFGDEMAMGALSALRGLDLPCPAAVSVVGFDDIRFAQYATPALTTVAQPMQEIGETAVRLLLDVLEGEIDRPTSVTLPHRLVLRASSGPVAR